MIVKMCSANRETEDWEIPDKEPPPVLRKHRLLDPVTGASEVVIFRLRNPVQGINGKWTAEYHEDYST